MRIKLKSVEDQVIVVTGASSGIGMATARAAATRGAKVVVAARSEEGLREAVASIQDGGGQASYVVADVSKEEEVQKIADHAVSQYGGFDTWVNNAAVSIYGRLMRVPVEDMRRLFEVNVWGVLHGCRVAVAHLRERGGAIINVGSILSERAIPLQGAYVASKHAVKGLTDTLRMELEEEGAPIAVTLVKPSAIDTPYYEHAKNYMESEPKPPAPVYSPQVVARAILHCAQKPVRDVTVGGAGRMFTAMEHQAPRLTDHYMKRALFAGQQKDTPDRNPGRNNLYSPMRDGEESGGYEGHVMRSSAYTAAALNPMTTALVLAGVGAAVGLGVRAWRNRGQAADTGYYGGFEDEEV
jgi:NAD(P)-dependent dehydrogenase (short-subunit alcohol dehydrogenase family)